MAQKILKVGSSAAVTIPKKLLEKLGLEIGDKVEIESAAQGGIVVRPAAKPTKRQERIARLTYDFIDRYRSDLEALSRK
jgi:AbrB family looped-hinge helix DNA binding protein